MGAWKIKAVNKHGDTTYYKVFNDAKEEDVEKEFSKVKERHPTAKLESIAKRR